MSNHTPRTIEIQLTKGYVATIDACDADLALLRWYATENGLQVYARRTLPKTRKKTDREYLHHAIMRRKSGLLFLNDFEVDHKDGNGLNNRRDNLRLASHRHNAQNQPIRSDNSSGVTGVNWQKHIQKWRAYITVQGKQINLGSFSEFEDAVAARQRAALEHFGNFARLD